MLVSFQRLISQGLTQGHHRGGVSVGERERVLSQLVVHPPGADVPRLVIHPPGTDVSRRTPRTVGALRPFVPFPPTSSSGRLPLRWLRLSSSLISIL